MREYNRHVLKIPLRIQELEAALRNAQKVTGDIKDERDHAWVQISELQSQAELYRAGDRKVNADP